MNNLRKYSTAIILSILFVDQICNAIQCMDQENNPVDWFVVYKLPKQSSHNNDLIKEGLGYVYITSNNIGNWTLSDLEISHNQSLVANTLGPFYNSTTKDLLYIFYNDQPPYGSSSEEKGHTKGIIIAKEDQGFWLIHSVPHFPYSLETYTYPTTGVHYGQSFLCISLNITNLNTVGLQLQYNEPHIFAQHIPAVFQTSSPDLYKAACNITVEKSPWFNIEHILSNKGVIFTSFSKSGKFQKDLYSDLVNLQLEANLDVETWPNEPDRLPSECDKIYQVNNVESVSILQANITFKSTVDHSKWAVSFVEDKATWICIGDINRAEPQTLRGGGTTCLNNILLAANYQAAIKDVENCKNTVGFVVNSI